MNKEEILTGVMDTAIEMILNTVDNIQDCADDIFKARQELNKILTDEENYTLTSKIKDKIQREINQSLDKSGGSGLVLAATGVGKSKVIVDRIHRLLDIIPIKVLLVVPTEKLRDEGWKEEFTKWGSQGDWESVTPICYASLGDFEEYDFDLIVLDECHNITEANSSYFERATYKNVIGLTATYPRDKIKSKLLSKYIPLIVYELNTDIAVKLGIVAPFDIIVVNIPLNRKDNDVKAGSKKNPFYTTEYRNYEYLFKLCLSSPNKFNYLKRMRFVYGLKHKTRATKFILNNIIPEHIRTLIFAGNIEQAEELCEYRHHSKSKKDSALGLFKEQKINRMSCVDALNEGENIDNLDCGLIVKLDSNALNLIQRIGRVIRYRAGHRGKIIILCAFETVDAEWVNKALSNFNQDNIRRINMEDLAIGKEKIEF